MKKVFKKIFTLFCVFAFVFSCVGCNGEISTPNSETQNSSFAESGNNSLLDITNCTTESQKFNLSINDFAIDPNLYQTVSNEFNSCEEIEEYYQNNSLFYQNGNQTSDANYYFLNVDSVYCESLNPYFPNFKLTYKQSESEGQPINNAIININCMVFDSNLGYYKGTPIPEELLDGQEIFSYEASIYALPFKYNGEKFHVKKYSYSDGVTYLNNVVCVYCEEKIVCAVFYYTELNISLDYFINLFSANGSLLQK